MNAVLAFLLAPGWSGRSLLLNLMEVRALRAIFHTIRTAGFTTWLSLELAPAGYGLTPARLSIGILEAEAQGWLSHILIGAVLYHCMRSLRSILWIALALEAHFFVSVNAAFLNPLNAGLDISFYLLGGTLAARTLSVTPAKCARWMTTAGVVVTMILIRRMVEHATPIAPAVFVSLGGLALLSSAALPNLRMQARGLLSSSKGLLLTLIVYFAMELQGWIGWNYATWNANNSWFMAILFLSLLKCQTRRTE